MRTKPRGRRIVHRYVVVFEPEPEGGFHVCCPALKGCHSHGETKEQALARIEEAIRGYLASLRKHGERPPPDDFADTVEVAA